MTDKEKLKLILNDPVLWIETFVKLADKKGNIIPFKLTPQQRYILQNKEKFNICLKSRQLGITCVSVAYSLYLTHTKPNVTCMIMSYSKAGVQEVFEKLRVQYYNLASCVKLPAVVDNRGELKFANNSRIINCTCGSKDNARGATLEFVHMSEVAHMNEKFDSQLLAIEQALVADGSMILESTANGLNRFSEMWNKTVSGELPLWKPFFFRWIDDKRMFADEYKLYSQMYENIYGSPLQTEELTDEEVSLFSKGATLEQLMWRRLKITSDGEEKFRQEFPSTPVEAFLSTGSNIFSTEIIYNRLNNINKMEIKKLPADADPILKKHQQYLTIWKLPTRKQRYYIGVDSGEGLGGSYDYSVISIVDKDGFQCAEWRSNKVKPYEFTEVVYKLATYYNKGLLVIEKASAGHTVLDRMKNDYHYVNLFKYKAYDQKTGKSRRQIGWSTDTKSKPMMISDMQEIFEKGQCLINSKALLEEMKLFEYTEKTTGDTKRTSMKAASGHDDAVMAFAMALQGMKSGQYYFPIGR